MDSEVLEWFITLMVGNCEQSAARHSCEMWKCLQAGDTDVRPTTNCHSLLCVVCWQHGIYDMHIHLASVPILDWEPPAFASTIHARSVVPVKRMHENCNLAQCQKTDTTLDNSHLTPHYKTHLAPHYKTDLWHHIGKLSSDAALENWLLTPH